MYNLRNNLIFQAVDKNEMITVRPKDLDFCMRIPLTEVGSLAVKDYVITILLDALRQLPDGCKIALINQKRDSREFKFDKPPHDYKEICLAIDEEKKRLRQCRDWISATVYYFFKEEGHFIKFCYEIEGTPNNPA